jgi:hypothetical protein
MGEKEREKTLEGEGWEGRGGEERGGECAGQRTLE